MRARSAGRGRRARRVLAALALALALGGAFPGASAAASGGMGGGPGAAGSGNLRQPPTLRGFPIADPGAASRSAETSLSHCSGDFLNERECIAGTLEAYAQALSELSPALPPQLQGLPNIVSHAAQSVRAARTREGAIRAIRSAIAEVKKVISLLRADDPEILKGETRAGAFVAETLEVADNKLEKAVGL